MGTINRGKFDHLSQVISIHTYNTLKEKQIDCNTLGPNLFSQHCVFGLILHVIKYILHFNKKAQNLSRCKV